MSSAADAASRAAASAASAAARVGPVGFGFEGGFELFPEVGGGSVGFSSPDGFGSAAIGSIGALLPTSGLSGS